MQKKFHKTKFLPVTLAALIYQRRIGLIDNTAYVIQAIQVGQPYRRVHNIRPMALRRQIGAPWPDGMMPERSFNAAIKKAGKMGLLTVTKDPNGSWLVVLSEELFSCLDPARVCRGSGNTLPEESPEAFQGKGSDRPKKEQSSSKDISYLKQTGEEEFCSVSTNVSSEEEEEQEQSERSAKPSQKIRKRSEQAEDSGKDQISAALEKSGGDAQFFIRTYLTRPVDGIAELVSQLEQASPPEICDAIDAMKQQEEKQPGRIKQPIRWLMRAISNRFKPNKGKNSPPPPSKRDPWLDMARQKGVVAASGRGDTPGGLWVLTHTEKWISVVQAKEIWPLEWLTSRPEDFSRRIEEFKQASKLEISVDGLLSKIGAEVSPDGLLVPVQGWQP